MSDLVTEIDLLIREVTSVLGNPLDSKRYQIVDRGIPHQPKNLPPNTMAVYAFWYGTTCLKIGKANKKSNARFVSQHYNAGSAQSTLAASILNDNRSKEFGINAEIAGDWIKKNCRRIDILLDASLGIFTLELIEAVLHYKYEPIYEGFATQR